MEENQTASARAQTSWPYDAGFFGVLTHKQSYLNLFYLLLSFPLGIFYFVVIVTGISLGFGLAIVGVGLFILLAVLMAMRGFAAVERQLSLWLLDAEIPPPDLGPDPWRHPLMALKKYATDSYTWRSLIYLMMKFPLGIVSFVIVVFFISLTMVLLLTPVLYHFTPLEIFYWHIVRPEEALICLAFGIILGFVAMHLINAVAALWRGFASWMLNGAPARREPAKTGPVIIP